MCCVCIITHWYYFASYKCTYCSFFLLQISMYTATFLCVLNKFWNRTHSFTNGVTGIVLKVVVVDGLIAACKMSRLSWRQWRLNLRRSAGEQSILGQQLVFALKMRKLEKFSGKPGHGVSVYEFIEDMTRILKTRPTSQEEQVDLLEGPAKEEMRFRPIEEKRSLKAVLGILKFLIYFHLMVLQRQS